MNEALIRAFGSGEGDETNPVERIARDLLGAADGNPSIALRLAAGALVLAERRLEIRESMISRGYVRAALEDLPT